jgi:hypothetical protein
MKANKILFATLATILLSFALVFSGCESPVGGPDNSAGKTGDIYGSAYFSNAVEHGGITITLEKTDGIRTQTALGSLNAGRVVLNSEGEAGATTAPDGSYSFTAVPEGTYTIYASSRNSRERAVTTNVTVLPAQSVTAADLNLTPVGRISGTVTIGGNATGNDGFLVFIASTSYMAVTDSAGKFTISDVPVGTGYQILIMKGNYVTLWSTDTEVSTGATTPLGSKTLYAEDLGSGGGTSLIWKGSLAAAPADPQLNWAYYNTAAGISYIYDGGSWQILAQNGASGISLVWKGNLAAAPATPQTNWAYYDTAAGISYIYDGSAWQILAKDGINGTDGADGVNGADGQNGAAGLDGISLVWKGSLTAHPANPLSNWAYYNSAQGKSYIYDGSDWQIIAQDGVNGEDGAPGRDGTDGQNGADGRDGTDGQDGSPGRDGTDGQNGADGISLVWQGSFTAPPADPLTNWAYYDTVQGKSYVYDGNDWQIIAQDGIHGGADGVSLVWKGSYTTNPENPQTNWAYYNTNDRKSYVYDGSTWQIIAQDGVDGRDGIDGQNGVDGWNGTDGRDGTDGQNGISIEWKGDLLSPPADPQINWAYYNTADRKSYVYDGRDWQIIAQDGKDLTAATTPPPAPAGFAVIPDSVTDSSVGLQWNPSTLAESYQVLMSVSRDGQYEPVHLSKIAYDGASAAVTGLTMSRTYWFKVIALNAEGPSDPSVAISVNTSAVATSPPAAAPANVRISTVVLPAYNEVTLEWEQVPGAEYYQIYASTAEDGTYTAAGDRIRPIYSSGAAAGLEGNTAYWFKVAAGNSAGEGPLSGPAVAGATSSSPLPLPLTPADFRVIATSSDSVELQWQNVDDVTGYKIYWSGSVTGIFLPRDENITTPTTAITGLTANHEYYFKVVSVNPTGESPLSPTLSTATKPVITELTYNTGGSSYYYYPSVAVDGNGYVHTVFRQKSNDNLFYATNASGSWTPPVNIAGVKAGMPCLRIDGDGNLHLAYWDMSSGYLKYATNKSGEWETVDVDNGNGLGAGAALALDSGGNIHLSYHDYTNNKVKYATNKSGSWVKDDAVLSVNRDSESRNVSTGIAVDSAGTIYIVYSCYRSSSPYNALYGTKKIPGQVWGTPELILSSGNGHFFNIDMKLSGDTPCFIYSQNTNLGLVTWENGVWKPGVLDADCYSYNYDDEAMRPSLDIDSSGALYVSYQVRLSNNQYSLKYGTNASGAWQFRIPAGLILDTSSSYYYNYNAARYSGIGVDNATGKVHIVYNKYDRVSDRERHSLNHTAVGF